ncbi:conserved hypothetical protein [Leishmania infantum JPCM5]|uniref:Uncharacterized protein n=2 Tax=Leishmania infantum TaxID=5671 RepID=A4IE39_LEIIN|nr:conserved hypothetical protein [Leishmania infantum JPCM5]CAC9551815.1 hypothetical_protein_-_conserved [Leishmania infantum]CAM73129.1 conserved hypothetical protein [Leishmania infantum JPCM5]SUZ46836.1 hypothetical_protein_-_conserved [Leishmania infantum]|eukprot:XP_001470008.1 conserved hypothetical protein [Leishmania infantum JPCM5]
MRPVAASACLYMDDSRGSALFPQPSTPEPQRFQFRSLRWCPEAQTPTAQRNGSVPYAAEEVAYMYADEEGVPHAQRSNVGHLTRSQPQDDGASPCTPRTVCQPRTRQRAELASAHPFSASLRTAHASAAPLQQSPCSFMPSIADAPVVRRTRSLSCPSADRSVAPARCSVGYGTSSGVAGQNIGRHTTVLSAVPPAGVKMCGSPSAVSAACSTVPLHSALSTTAHSMANEQGRALPERHDGVDLPACGSNDAFFAHTYTTQPCATSASVPRLTRLSLSSSGHSPAVLTNWSIGRPTTLRCRDTDSDVHCDWGAIQGEDEAEKKSLIGCATQVWRVSAEVRMPLQCSHGTEAKEEETLLGDPTSHGGDYLTNGRDVFASSPPIAWQPAPLPASFAASQLDLSGCGQDNAVLLSGVPVASAEEEAHNESREVTRSNAIPTTGDIAATKSNGSFAGLEAAPRKGYARSNSGTPPRSDLGSPNNAANLKAQGRAANGASAGVELASRAAASETNSHHFGASLCANIGSGCSARLGIAAEWRDHMCTATPQGRGVWVDAPAQLRGSEYPPSTTMAEAVAARLAHISIHTSPTPKRLAFEEEELVERVSGGGSPTLIPAVRNVADGAARRRACNDASAAQGGGGSTEVGLLGKGAGGLGSSGMRWASAFGDSGHRELCSSHIPSGLQLLRSRKRCLAEMQATDTQERHADTLATVGINDAHDASYLVPDRVGPMSLATPFENLEEEGSDGDEEAVKRQRREEQRRTRLQHLLPASLNTMDDLIPSPARALGTGVAPCSFLLSSRVCSAVHGIQSAQDQQHQQDRTRNDDPVSWSQMSSISYVTPASQSTSMGLWGMSSTLSQDHHGGAVVCSVGSGSQVLTPLPTNVTPQPSRKP